MNKTKSLSPGASSQGRRWSSSDSVFRISASVFVCMGQCFISLANTMGKKNLQLYTRKKSEEEGVSVGSKHKCLSPS